ncbi:MAG: hypothetical protein KZQ94_04625 [Candidatus Thiodiazotropha sp. (ex Troendleina suluensis)]|nr:hypothetical protein [Candidatus Thiodiazotropha sp. (ex Troendleina suluensis)]
MTDLNKDKPIHDTDIATQQRLERIDDCLYGIKMTARVLELDMLEDFEEENPKSLGEYIKGGLIAAIRQLSYSANNDLSMIRDSMHEGSRSNEAE